MNRPNSPTSTLSGSADPRVDSAKTCLDTVNSGLVRHVDRELLLCLRSGDSKTIGELTDQLGVTATAVRQRIDRLLELDLIEREKVVAGRGRPTYQYRLTMGGFRRAGADASMLAEVMWREILDFPNEDVREQLISAIACRLGQHYAQRMSHDSAEPHVDLGFADRMKHLSEMLRGGEIAAIVSEATDLPVLDIESCPYPNLTDASGDRSMCRLEEQMISEALGEEVHLSSCRLDGDSCCQFSSTANSASQPSSSD